MKYVFLLNNITKAKYNIIGGKGINLARLCQYDFCVPQGFCLTIDAYKDFIRKNNLDSKINQLISSYNLKNYEHIKSIAREIQQYIKNGAIPREIVQEIKNMLNRMDCKCFAIRSSATAEDLKEASFAGQYDSYLNLQKLDDILSHIKKCYASLWTSRAISYRIRNNIPLKEIFIAIMIQEMIASKTSGVLFTINPVNGKSSEMLIESNFGLGESVMSGHSTPDQFIIKWNENDNSSFKILDQRIGEKEYIIQPHMKNGYGTEKIKLTEKKKMQASLTKAQLINLAQLGKQIEQTFGNPQDIEWALDKDGKFHILQTRPVTGLDRDRQETALDGNWYTRGYSDDYWNDPVTPLFFDLLGDQLTYVVNMELNSIMGYRRMEAKLLKLHKAHVYFNLDVLRRKVEYEIPSFLRNENILNYFPKGIGPYGKQIVKNLDFHLIDRIVAELRIMLFDPNGSMTRTDKAYYEWTEQEFIPFCKQFDERLDILSKNENLGALFDLAEELDKKMIAHFELVRYGIPVHNIGMNLMSQFLLNKFIGKKEAMRYFPLLISGLDHKLTQTNEEIYRLASMIQQSKELKNIISNIDSEKILAHLKEKEDSEFKLFLTRVQDFLKEYGHRGFTREPYYPRWRNEPKYVFDIFKSLIRGKEEKWIKKKKINKLRTKIIERKVETKIRSQFLGLLKWKLFSIILNFSRRYICFRENQRYNLDIWITKNRNIYLKIGEILKRSDIFDERKDIFFLRKNEIKNIIKHSKELLEIDKIKAKIKDRKQEFLQFENKTPPKFLIGDMQYSDIEVSNGVHNILKGIPASQGIKTGIIRILREIADIPNVKSNEILVVPRTDPGWTPVFSRIGGLITETGGVLSHGAVVSREYNIPAVTNIPSATSLLKTGQQVQINGFNGEVTIISK
ncbi:MAG: hypothetical protein EU541_03260 [Promethearchaeota archaeon]|nr:MAG: hypothetical protein EU541_03260 [Candidatus Lokiarchaeota archaeon]